MKSKLRAALAAILFAVAVLGVAGGAPLPQHARNSSLGVANCASSLCHGAVEPWKGSRVLQTEYVTWSRQDKHARAYTVLLGARSREIADKLGLTAPAHRSRECLDCHAHHVNPPQRGERFVLADGVSCEACHGAAERWVRTHVEPGATRAQNLANGMYPVWDDVARAQLCLSCHFGTSQKFVTHKMLAAGHPRMSFELDTFTEIQPRHFVPDRSGMGGVRAWAIGQAISAQTLLDMLSDPVRGRDGLFPELVLFDCHACHHPMSDMRNRGARVASLPGFVRLNDASLLMLRQIAARIDPHTAKELSMRTRLLHRAIAAGDDALTQARATRSVVEALIPGIRARSFSAEDLRAMLLGLIDDGLAGEYRDYQGAEQAVMALQSLVDMMSRRNLVRARALGPSMMRLLAVVADDERYNPSQLEQGLRELRKQLVPSASRP